MGPTPKIGAVPMNVSFRGSLPALRRRDNGESCLQTKLALRLLIKWGILSGRAKAISFGRVFDRLRIW
jgi:hypothetical protein